MRILFFIKISAMVFALVAIFYAMRYLRSQEFVQQTSSPDSPMAILLGTAELKPYNWCPPGVQKVQIVTSGRLLTDAKEMIGVCQVMMGPVLKADADIKDYQIVAVASSGKIERKIERNSKNVFRVEGLPFHSKFLEKTF